MADLTTSEEALATQTFWSNFSPVYEEINKKFTIQSAQELHRHLTLNQAQTVIEVGCGGAIGTLDLVTHLSSNAVLYATDYSPVMVESAKERCKENPSIKVQNANGMALTDFESNSMDRYVSSLTLQLVPDPDSMMREAFRVLKPGGIAGFTVWGREENGGIFTIQREAGLKMGLKGAVEPHPNFKFQTTDMKERFHTAGFDNVRIWPYWLIAELWEAEAYAEFFLPRLGKMQADLPEEEKDTFRQTVVNDVAQKWLVEKAKPIGLEVYIILARKN